MIKGLRIELVRVAIMDNPNQRSMHTQPVPRGGGWSFAIPCAAFLCLSSLLHYMGSEGELPFPEILLLIGLLLLAGVSWADDRGGVKARWRLLAHFAAAALGLLALGSFPAPDWVPNWILYAGLAIAWVWFINLYNFMDGIDGITTVETISIVLPLTFIVLTANAFRLPPGSLIYLPSILLGSSIGFLFFNWHPAKIFLGDVGSVPIGYLVGFCLLALAQAGFWYIALTLPLYYLADSGITIVRRFLKGEKIWEAHRSHFYQRAAQREGRHDVVVVRIALCNVALWAIAAAALLISPWMTLLAPLPVGLLLWWMAGPKTQAQVTA
ncbi:MAG: glycosyltransferase family 4 protein [Alphaproteobacteria bacterium]